MCMTFLGTTTHGWKIGWKKVYRRGESIQGIYILSPLYEGINTAAYLKFGYYSLYGSMVNSIFQNKTQWYNPDYPQCPPETQPVTLGAGFFHAYDTVENLDEIPEYSSMEIIPVYLGPTIYYGTHHEICAEILIVPTKAERYEIYKKYGVNFKGDRI